MPLIRVEIIDWNTAVLLKQQIAEAQTIDDLKVAVTAVVDHLARIEYLGDVDE